MKKSNENVKNMVQGAIIAALYVALTMFSFLFGLSSGPIQIRFSEALCILPIFFPAAIPGLCVGCFLSNLLTGAVIWDVIFGTLATLIGAVGTYFLRRKSFLGFWPPILANSLIIPLVLKYAYGLTQGLSYIMIAVFAGEVISIGIFGTILYLFLRKKPKTKLDKSKKEKR